MGTNYSTGDQYAVLRYLRDSLLDTERRSIDENYFKTAKKITFRNIQKGEVNSDKAEKIIKEFEKKSKKKQKRPSFDSHNDSLPTICDVLICPFRRLPKNKDKNNDTQDPLTPLWIPATLHNDGKLTPSNKLFPWIEREYLFANNSTSRQKKKHLLGSTEDEERYRALHPVSEIEKKWKPYLEWSLDFIAYFTDQGHFEFDYSEEKVTTFSFGGNEYLFDEHAYIAPDPDIITGSGKAIIKLYNELINNKEANPLVTSFCNLPDRKTRPVIDENKIHEDLTAHLGQMNGEFPLAQSQRQALHHFTALREGEILAVNGPPGTGKTTLLQSIVANLVIEKALKDGDPPVILASSANNQAITNIIESFETDNTDDSLSERWLPDPVSSYGLYCPSKNKKSNAIEQGIRYTNLRGVGFPSQVENEAFVNKAKKRLKKKAEEYFAESFTHISEIRFYLLDRLKEMQQILKKGENLLQMRKKSSLRLGPKTITNNLQIKDELKALQTRIKGLENERANIFERINNLKNVKNKWESSYQNLPFYTRWLGTILSFFENRIKIHNQFFFQDYSFNPDDSELGSYDSVLNFFSSTLTQLRSKTERIENKISEIRQYDNLVRRINEWLDKHVDAQNSGTNKKELSLLDTQLRHKMFLYATHYWECRWIAETDLFLKVEQDYCKENTKKQWLRYAKLTPCFVSTFFMLPKYISHYVNDKNEPFINFADLLIVDEAGQVSPELGGANFGLAKKALIVGDTKQIQPIWKIGRDIDQENAAKHIPVEKVEYSDLKLNGLTANGGSVMKVAQQQSPYQLDHIEVGGMFLSEHWRCRPKIIDYCNNLVYKGQLEPQLDGEPYHLPRMGYAHISGQSQTDHSASRYNQREAKVIARWIKDNKSKLLEESDESNIEDVIAVVTPFRGQSTEITRYLKKMNAGLDDITVGTVHSLQGAEREVIIFSSVYGQHDSSNYFFDQDVMMLNVAVSRAKESFLVFGDMHIFDPSVQHSPSGILASYLFRNSHNELTNITLPKREQLFKKNAPLKWTQVDENHQKLLEYCFEHAQTNITIASPFITKYAVASAGIPELIASAINRNVEVNCYVDAYLNKSNGKINNSAQNGINMLKEAGASVNVAEKFHNKTLCADHFLICEGSFNWLSAQRKKTDKYYRYERSLVYWDENRSENKTIKEFISIFKEEMEKRVLDSE